VFDASQVGMTGDGVNDAPALKRADVGVAVKGATEAAQSAAAIILTQPGVFFMIYTSKFGKEDIDGPLAWMTRWR